MNKTLQVSLVVGVILSIVLGVLSLNSKSIVRETVREVGGVASPDSPFNYYGVGGVRDYKHAIALNTSTSTICAIQAPAATSTLVAGAVRFDVSSTSASIVDLGIDSTAYATTTIVGSYVIGAGKQAVVVATTTPSTGMNTLVVPPNYWFVAKQMGGANNVFSPVGSCQATFEVI